MSRIASIVRLLISSRPVQWVLAILAALAAIRIRDRSQRKAGAEAEREIHEQADKDIALDIHRRAADAKRVPIDIEDERIYRD
ncbi:MAG: hypothetical protein AAF098_16885 [Pseudomonadota bacterium]